MRTTTAWLWKRQIWSKSPAARPLNRSPSAATRRVRVQRRAGALRRLTFLSLDLRLVERGRLGDHGGQRRFRSAARCVWVCVTHRSDREHGDEPRAQRSRGGPCESDAGVLMPLRRLSGEDAWAQLVTHGEMRLNTQLVESYIRRQSGSHGPCLRVMSIWR